jgi:hypothetical protein
VAQLGEEAGGVPQRQRRVLQRQLRDLLEGGMDVRASEPNEWVEAERAIRRARRFRRALGNRNASGAPPRPST